MTEFSDLGNHCSLSDCKQLDFLPLKCDLCNLVFCKSHSSYTNHNCSKYEELNKLNIENAKSLPPITTYTCSLDDCKTKELVQVLCEFCKLNFCMTHRLQIDHHCKCLADQNKSGSSHVQVKPVNQPFKFEVKTNVSEKNAGLASKLVLMKMKQTADGPPGLPEESKFYCFIMYNNVKKPFFFSLKWPIGRCIEFLCTKLNAKSDGKLSLMFENKQIIDTSLTCQELMSKNDVKHGDLLHLSSL